MKKSKMKSENILIQMKINHIFPNLLDVAKAEESLKWYCGPQETRKISKKQTNLPPKEIRKRRTHKAQSQQKEGIK